MAAVMFTIASPSGAPSLAEASRQLGIELGALDQDFGVILIDPRRGLYSVLVDEHLAHRVAGSAGAAVGPFSNPKIGTFGPIEQKN